MTLTPQQTQALFTLADAIRATAEAFGNPAEAAAERIAIQNEPPAAPAADDSIPFEPAPESEYTVKELRDFLTHAAKERGRGAVTEILNGRKVGDMDEPQRIALRDELKEALGL